MFQILFVLLGVFVLESANGATSKLPVIIFHGVLATWEFGHNFEANLTVEGRDVVALFFCDVQCSIESLVTQIPMAVKVVRAANANNSTFGGGYIIIGHSLGGMIARAMIEETDDHQAK